MNSRIILIAAAALGFLAAILNYSYLSSLQTSGLTVLKVKPGATLKAGEPVDVAMFDPVTIYGDLPQLRGLTVTEQDLPSFADKPLVVDLEPGELLLQRSFRLTGDEGLFEKIDTGQRALSVQVGDEARTVGFFVNPGDVVDIYAVVMGQAVLLKARAKVQAVGETYRRAGSGNERNFRSITLIVPEKDVAPLITNLELAHGQVTLALVGAKDSATSKASDALPAITITKEGTAKLPGTPTPAPAPAPAPTNTNAAPPQ